MAGPLSGIRLSKEAEKFFQENMKLNRVSQAQKYRYMLMTISDELGEVVMTDKVEKGADQQEDFKKMVEQVPMDKACYIILDMASSSGKDQLYFITWCPDTLPTKQKMCSASTKTSIQNVFKGTKMKQVNDLGDFTYESILE